jgi:hypothetical protein
LLSSSGPGFFCGQTSDGILGFQITLFKSGIHDRFEGHVLSGYVEDPMSVLLDYLNEPIG